MPVTPAEEFVSHVYGRFPGRVRFVAGIAYGFGEVYPFVVEDDGGKPIGLVACAWNKESAPDLVQVFHISAFHTQQGMGSWILDWLCAQADNFNVRLYVQPTPIWIENEPGLDEDALKAWYGRRGFLGAFGLTRGARH